MGGTQANPSCSTAGSARLDAVCVAAGPETSLGSDFSSKTKRHTHWPEAQEFGRRRFRDSGRMAPEGLIYVSSWIDVKLERCYQLMETHDRRLLDEWMANWSDLVNFEVHAVVTSKEAAEKIAPLL